MLSDDQEDTLRQLLFQEKQRILALAPQDMSYTRERVNRRGDVLDESSEEALFADKMRLTARDQALLTRITDALDLLEAGVLDECKSCGDIIPHARLLARPTATYCLQCQADREDDASRVKLAEGRWEENSLVGLAPGRGATPEPKTKSDVDPHDES